MLAKRRAWKEGHKDGRKREMKGSMPFSLIAVLLLVLSSVSIAVLYSYDRSHEDARLPAETIGQMRDDAVAASEDVMRLAYSAALEAIRETRDLDENALTLRFQEAFADALNETYPDTSGRFCISIHHANVTLSFLRASLEDAYVTYGGDETLGGRVSLPAFFALSGTFVLNVSSPQGRILYGQDICRDIYLPLPFLFDRLARLTASAAPFGDLESMVRYMLTALAQERVLMGYGMGAQIGAWSTESIVTDEDVVRAVNLAVVLEQLRIFRAASVSALAEFPELQDNLEKDLEDGLDPADLFLSCYGDGSFDLAPLVSQSILAVMDRMIVSLLEYFHIIDIANIAEDVFESVVWGLRDIGDLLTGGDSAQGDIVNYLSETMSEAGYPESFYRWFNYGGPNALVTLPERKIYFSDDSGELFAKTFKGTYAVDFPDVDVYASEAWGEFYRQYVSSTHELVRQVKGFIATVADLMATHCSLRSIDLALDPTDDRGVLEEIASQVAMAFKEEPEFMRPALEQAHGIKAVQDDLALAAMAFIGKEWPKLLERDYSVIYAAHQLSEVLVKELDGTPNFSGEARQNAQLMIEAFLLDVNWGLPVLQDAFASVARYVLEPFEDALSKKNTSSVWNYFARAFAFGISHLPGIEAVVAASMLKMVNDMTAAARLWGGKMKAPVGQEGFVLTSRSGLERNEYLEVLSDSLSLSTDGTTGLAVEIKRPWEFDREDSSYPNRHVTDIGNMSFSPYLTQWDISYEGSVRMTLRLAQSTFDGAAIADVPVTVDIPLAGHFSVVTNSAWSLKGIDYRPTATLAEDLVKFITAAWNFLVSGSQTIAGTACKAFNIFAQLVSIVLTAAVKPLEMLNDLLMAGVDALKRLITGALSDIIGAIADVTQAVLGGTTIRLSLLGVTASLIIAPRDSKLAGTDDQIRIDTSMSLFGTSVTTSLRVLRFEDGTHSIVGNLAMSRDDWRVEMIIDPLTKIYQHVVEAKGFFGDKVIELSLGEVVRNQKVSVKLSDIPGLGAMLRLIPSPIPGAKLHIDGGIEVSFNLLSKDTVMINEFEQNPKGEDRGREWVELFNPTDRPVDLSGWSLVTSHGQTGKEVLGQVIVPAQGYYVHTFSGQFLDNGGDQGFPLHESLALLDPSGSRVDSAPWTKDLADDERTWQRSYDGSGTWELREGSRGRSNGGVLFHNTGMDGLANMIVWSFEDAFKGSMVPDARGVEDLFRSALAGLRDSLLDAVGDAVSSVEVFLRLGLDDYTGTMGTGVGLALVADGKGVRACFAWAADAVGELLCDPLNPLAAIKRAPVPVDELAQHVFIQFKAYVSVGLPDFVEAIGGERSVKASVTMQWSLGAIGLGSGGGRTTFGLVISGLPGPRIKTGGFSASDTVSVWMLKGSVSWS